jgi:hypothetical protein
MHPGVVPAAADEEEVQEVEVPPGASWTAWALAPSTGGVSGRPYASMARYNPSQHLLEVTFANTGKRWEYPGVGPADWAGYLAGTRSYPVLNSPQWAFGRGQASRQFEKF